MVLVKTHKNKTYRGAIIRDRSFIFNPLKIFSYIFL